MNEIEKLEKVEIKTKDILKSIEEKNDSLLQIRSAKMKGVLLRSKARWLLEGEKVTKYSLNEKIIGGLFYLMINKDISIIIDIFILL